MATLQQVQRGLCRYVDTELLPKMTGIKKIGLGAYMALAANNLTALAANYLEHPAIKILGLSDAQGNIDIDKAYNAVIPMFDNGVKHSVDLPLVGSIILDRSDVDKLHRYIVGG